MSMVESELTCQAAAVAVTALCVYLRKNVRRDVENEKEPRARG